MSNSLQSETRKRTSFARWPPTQKLLGRPLLGSGQNKTKIVDREMQTLACVWFGEQRRSRFKGYDVCPCKYEEKRWPASMPRGRERRRHGHGQLHPSSSGSGTRGVFVLLSISRRRSLLMRSWAQWLTTVEPVQLQGPGPAMALCPPPGAAASSWTLSGGYFFSSRPVKVLFVGLASFGFLTNFFSKNQQS